MATDIEHFASGNWFVEEGNEEEFVARWTEFLEWTRATFPQLRYANLIRRADDPSHFISFANWESTDALADWRSRPEFAERFGACRNLCRDFIGGDFRRVADV